MKPRIQLIGGCTSTSFVNEVVSDRIPEPGNDSSEIATVAGGVASALLEELLAAIITSVNASAGIVKVLSPDGLALRTTGCKGLSPELYQSECATDSGCGVCGKSAGENTLASSDSDFCKRQYGADFFGEKCKFVLAVPLSHGDDENELAGVLTLFFAEEKEITPDLDRTLTSFGQLIRISLKNVWHNEDRHQTDLLAERQSIANEIHDSLAQTLYFAKIRSSLLLDALKSKNELLAYSCAQDIDEALEGSQKTVRELVTHFRCQMDARGLKFALQKLAHDFVARGDIALEYSDQVEEFNLPLEFELQIFLIVREALVNIATHSGATIARLTAMRTINQYRFIIEDNGGGVASSTPPEGHYGLEIMHERALRIGGVVEVESLQGQGTRVQLVFNAPEA